MIIEPVTRRLKSLIKLPGFQPNRATELTHYSLLAVCFLFTGLLIFIPDDQPAVASPILTTSPDHFENTPLKAVLTPGDTLEWNRPRIAERQEERERLVDTHLAPQDIHDERILDAIRYVPRHEFVPARLRGQAYHNNPLPIGYGQTISQPYIVAYMNQMLNLTPGDKVLEIGTGSGYHAATLSELTPHVYSIEIIRELGERAADVYRELGYETIQTKIADGYFGWEEHAPFDAIIVTAAAGHVPQPLIEQLKPGGVIVIPIGSPYQVQTLMRIRKDEEGNIRTERDMPVRFVPMTGQVQEP